MNRLLFLCAALALSASACADAASTPTALPTSTSTAVLSATPQQPEAITVGAEAPDFTLANVDGTSVSLADYRGKHAVLLYFSMGAG